MMYRNFLAMETEELLRSYPVDGCVLMGGCDKTTPGLLMALGGSTNGLIHVIALAGRAGFDVALERFEEIGRRTPYLVNMRPSRSYLMEDFYYAGGLVGMLEGMRKLLGHAGRAVVFDDYNDMAARIDDPDLDVDADSVLVLRNSGPLGGPGMPELETSSLNCLGVLDA